MKKETTTIRIRKETKLLLDKSGIKSESYDDIILRLLKGGSKNGTSKI